MTPTAIAQILRRAEILGEIDDAGRAAIAARVLPVRVSSGSWVIRQGEPAEALYVVSTGQVRVVATLPDGQEVTFATVGPGGMVGEMGLLDGEPRSAGVLAVVDSILLALQRPDFLRLLTQHPDLSMALMRKLSGRVRSLDREIEEGASLSGRQRLARHLLRIAAQQGHSGGEPVVLEGHLPQSVLASSLGLSRQTVNGLLQEMQAQGLIEVHRAKVTLLTPSALAGVGAD
jgi:CRP/FNR family transcriptional regulator, cyclic AMP receptor protein